jgi:hypothetical protein
MSLLRESASVDVLQYNTVMYALIRIITVRETVVYRFHLQYALTVFVLLKLLFTVFNRAVYARSQPSLFDFLIDFYIC